MVSCTETMQSRTAGKICPLQMKATSKKQTAALRAGTESVLIAPSLEQVECEGKFGIDDPNE